MANVTFRDSIDRTVSANETGTLLDLSLSLGLPHYHQCNGKARCTTCRVRIHTGHANLSPRTAPELEVADRHGWDDSMRLACQTRVLGDVSLSRVLLDSETVAGVFDRGDSPIPPEEKSLAIMFCDMRNFTGFAASHLPQDVVYVLNRYFREVCDPVLENDGYIDKYLGDGFLAVFGLNQNDSRKACLQALRAAVRIPAKMEAFNRWLREAFQLEFNFGIGLHFGPVVIGETGHPYKMQLTVLGDTVNIASRIESQTKITGAQILGSSAFVEQVPMEAGEQFRVKVTRAGFWDTLSAISLAQVRDPILLVQESYDRLRPRADEFASLFYEKLFAAAPEAARLFAGTDMSAMRRIFMETIGRCVQKIDRLPGLAAEMSALGAHHTTRGVTADHFEIGGAALLSALRDFGTSDKALDAWAAFYGEITRLMLSET